MCLCYGAALRVCAWVVASNATQSPPGTHAAQTAPKSPLCLRQSPPPRARHQPVGPERSPHGAGRGALSHPDRRPRPWRPGGQVPNRGAHRAKRIAKQPLCQVGILGPKQGAGSTVVSLVTLLVLAKTRGPAAPFLCLRRGHLPKAAAADASIRLQPALLIHHHPTTRAGVLFPCCCVQNHPTISVRQAGREGFLGRARASKGKG